MPLDERLTWGQLFLALGLTPGMQAAQTRVDSSADILDTFNRGGRKATFDQKLSLMSGLLAPFFCPLITNDDVFEIARAGESSAHMFKVFQERDQIALVLDRCKGLKSSPVLMLAIEGPKALAQLAVRLLESGAATEKWPENLADNFVSFFINGPAQRHAEAIRAFSKDSSPILVPDVDVLAVVSDLPGWSLITRESHPMLWASRHDEVAVILKNAQLRHSTKQQKTAAGMMEEAIRVFEEAGEHKDAAIAKSNLGNLLSRAEWLTIEARQKRARSLYDSALESADALEPEFRALLMDNLASRLGDLGAMGDPHAAREGLETSMRAAQLLESIGSERLPAVLANVVRHLTNLREHTGNRLEDLRKANEVGKKALDMIERSDADDRLRVLVINSLADVLVRSSDYEPERVKELCDEALRLIDTVTTDGTVSDLDSEWTRAKALHLLKDFSRALVATEKVLGRLEGRNAPPEFVAEVLRFLYLDLSQLLKAGDAQRVAAAERLAEYARTHDLVEEWSFGESAFLQECMFRAAEASSSTVDASIHRGEQVLSRLDTASEMARRLQCTLAAAYALRGAQSRREDDLMKAIELYGQIEESIPRQDRLATTSNITVAWLQMAATFGGPSIRALIPTIVRFTHSAQDANGETERDRDEFSSWRNADVSLIFRVAREFAHFLDDEENNAADEGGLRQRARALEDCAADVGSNATISLSNPWLVPACLEAAGHCHAAAGLDEEADKAFIAALEVVASISNKGLRRRIGWTVHESYFSSLCRQEPAQAIRQIAAREGFAAGWTACMEKAEATTGTMPPEARTALLAFETARFAQAVADGNLTVSGEGFPHDSDRLVRDADAALSRAGLPKFDSRGFALEPTSRISETDTTVILVPGRKSGHALVVPAGAAIHDAVSVPLPNYSLREAEAIAFDPNDGWLSTLLQWRGQRVEGAFDRALRRIAVRLWDTALGRVYEATRHIDQINGLNLVVRGNQRLLPWSCASPSSDLLNGATDVWRFSTGTDLGMRLLGLSRRSETRPANDRAAQKEKALTALLTGSLFAGIAPLDALDALVSPGASPLAVSITDGSGDLPLTRVEGGCIKKGFGKSTIVMSGGIAPGAAAWLFSLMEGAGLIHVACHGEWIPIHPWTSAVMLGPQFALFAATVRSRLQLHRPVVVLSACESGIGGPAAAGEGDLAQAFLLAGASVVVASSWMVHDLSSLVFADALLTHLATGSSAPTALNFARHTTRSITSKGLCALVEEWAIEVPSAAPALERSLNVAINRGDLPFAGPLHWAAHFAAIL